MTETAAWTNEPPDGAEDAPGAPGPVLLSSLLPLPAQRHIQAEGRAEACEARAEKRELPDRAETAYDKAVACYISEAADRGETVPMADVMHDQAVRQKAAEALARGEPVPDGLPPLRLGRTVDQVLDRCREWADRKPRDESQHYELLDAGEPVIRSRRYSRSDGWPSSERELDRQLRQADELHRDLVHTLARRDYQAAEEAARAKSTGGQASRSAYALGYGEITRVCSLDGRGNRQLGDVDGYVIA